MTLDDFVIEDTIYFVSCSYCPNQTKEHYCEENAVYEAEQMGFAIVDDEVLCPNCNQ